MGSRIFKSNPATLVSAGFLLVIILVGSESKMYEVAGSHGSFHAMPFETVSASGTVCLSMGITAALNTRGKIWIILMMVIGRVGVLTHAYIIAGTSATMGVEYSEEILMIG